jgi:hypothetical protein
VSFLIEDLIESVKDRSFAPISQSTFEDTDILRILNEELKLNIVADLLKAREDFFYYRKSVTIVANKSLYMLPKGAIGNTIAALFFVDSTGREWPLTRRDISDLGDYSTATGQPLHFYFQGDRVGFYPYPDTALGSFLFVFPKKPNKLVLTTSAAKISAISSLSGTTTFTVDTDLSGTLSVGSKVDFLRSESPYALWADEVAITAITTSTIAVATADVDDVAGTVEPEVNDYICANGQANIAQIPEEWHPVLAIRGALRLIAGLGDLNKANSLRADLKEASDKALGMVKNRAETAPDKITRKSPLVRAFRGG